MSETTAEEDQNQWRFVLASTDGDQKLVASDIEPATQGERLELLSVVRGLEALEQPSQVTLLTDSRYVSQGIAHGLSEWRSNDWCWERFGELTPVKNLDLWQRVDRALKFHRVDCRTWRFDSAHTPADSVPAAVVPLPEPSMPAVKQSQTLAAVRPAKARLAAARRRDSEQATAPTRSERAAEQSETLVEPRPEQRPGLLAACRGWLQRASTSVRELQTKVSLEANRAAGS
jgi:ribonuclease HI